MAPPPGEYERGARARHRGLRHRWKAARVFVSLEPRFGLGGSSCDSRSGGQDFRLLARPEIAAPGVGTAEIALPARSGEIFRFSIRPLLASGGAVAPL